MFFDHDQVPSVICSSVGNLIVRKYRSSLFRLLQVYQLITSIATGSSPIQIVYTHFFTTYMLTLLGYHWSLCSSFNFSPPSRSFSNLPSLILTLFLWRAWVEKTGSPATTANFYLAPFSHLALYANVKEPTHYLHLFWCTCHHHYQTSTKRRRC